MSEFKSFMTVGSLDLSPDAAPPVDLTSGLRPESAGLQPVPLSEAIARMHTYKMQMPRRPINLDDAYRDSFAKPIFASEPEPATDDADVLPITAPQRDMREVAAELLARASQVVMRADVRGDDELTGTKSNLLSELIAFTETLATFLSDVRARSIETLTEEHLQLVKACRAQRTAVQELQVEVDQMTADLQRLENQRSAATLDLNNHLASKPNPDNWPSRRVVADWNKRLEQLRLAVDSIGAAMSPIDWDLGIARRELAAAQGALADLAAKERLVRNKLTGQAFGDPTRPGLQHEPVL